MPFATQKAIVLTEISDSLDVVKYTDVEVPEVGPDDILIKNKYAGVNYVDISLRTGVIPAPYLPIILGCEALGFVSAIGSNVRNYSVGDKVAYIDLNAFAQYKKVKKDFLKLGKLDHDITEEQFKLHGSVPIQVLTALILVERASQVEAGHNILVWAAAGGVGHILTQLISAKGAHVIAVASTPEKLALAKSLGAKYLINGLTDDVSKKVQEYTNGQGVDVVYDGIGKAVFDVSLSVLVKSGTLVSYGGVTGYIDEVQAARVEAAGAKLSRSGLPTFIKDSESWNYWFDQLKVLIKTGSLKIEVSQTYPLSEYSEAFLALEKRESSGKLVFSIPQ